MNDTDDTVETTVTTEKETVEVSEPTPTETDHEAGPVSPPVEDNPSTPAQDVVDAVHEVQAENTEEG